MANIHELQDLQKIRNLTLLQVHTTSLIPAPHPSVIAAQIQGASLLLTHIAHCFHSFPACSARGAEEPSPGPFRSDNTDIYCPSWTRS